MKGTVQAVLIPKKWKRDAIEKWLARHKFKAELVEDAEHWIAEQQPRDAFGSVRSVRKARGIVFRYGYDAPAPEPARDRAWWDVPLGELFNRPV